MSDVMKPGALGKVDDWANKSEWMKGMEVLRTPTGSLLCDLFALKLSIENQLNHVKPPTIEDLVSITETLKIKSYSSLSHSQLQMILQWWGFGQGLLLRMSVVLADQKISTGDFVEKPNTTTVWLYNNVSSDELNDLDLTNDWSGLRCEATTGSDTIDSSSEASDNPSSQYDSDLSYDSDSGPITFTRKRLRDLLAPASPSNST